MYLYISTHFSGSLCTAEGSKMFENKNQVSVEKSNHIPHTYQENENLTSIELL